MNGVTGGLAGLVVGAVVSALWFSLRCRLVTGELRVATRVAQARVEDLHGQLDRERLAHAEALGNLDTVFQARSAEVLAQTVDRFAQSQETVQREREERLRDNLRPLADALQTYQERLTQFDETHQRALYDVQRRAEELLNAQRDTQNETQRLSQLLGRSDQRGRWGEVQLANLLDASGLREGVDYDLQRSTTEEGRRQRPDCIINLPRGVRIVVDAKFPYDAFERALATTDDTERQRAAKEYSVALRGHIRQLSAKNYFATLDFSPEYTVCFVPSESALSLALSADPELLTGATDQRVIVASPTTLLALLWTAAEVVRHAQAARNAQEIMGLAQELLSRIRNVADPLIKLGRSLKDATESYNQAVRSVEARLLPLARRVQDLAAVEDAVRELPEISSVTTVLDASRWGIDPANDEWGERSVILDATSPDVPETAD
jgi:DNA recombination protein RmuC